MIRNKHVTTTFVAATSLAAMLPAGAAAHHILGHTTLSAVQQDIKAAADEADRQVSYVKDAVENTGANTRRHLQETVDTRVRAVERAVTRTRSSAQAQGERTQAQVTSTQGSVNRRVASGQSRARAAVAQGEERAERASAPGRRRAKRAQAWAQNRAQQERSRTEYRARRAWASAEREYAMAERRAQILVYRITRDVDTLLASGSVGVTTSGGEYSAGWTRSGGCWTVRLSTPLDLPGSRFKRSTGKSVQPLYGHRTSARTSSGDVTASTGC